ncbi:hypothetical protein [uncultured Clostridium sp.]|uniref:hypothetical protein n=1 Tax=uncultured Clostridium sp. TaxID=59620 RepID=UPI002618B6EC|nr:hypothetical protein [uncultured Clostridium sp.]
MNEIINVIEARGQRKYHLKFIGIKNFEIEELKREIEVDRSERVENYLLEEKYNQLSELLMSLNFLERKVIVLDKILDLSKLL